MLEYFSEYDQTTCNIRIMLAFTFGHGSCQKNEFFTDVSDNGYTFSCKKFAKFLYEVAYYSTENAYMMKVVFATAFYIAKQPNLLLKFCNYDTFKDRVKLVEYAKTSSSNRATVGRNINFPGCRFIILPFSISMDRKGSLKFFQLFPMYFTWDMENQEEHRILKNFTEAYPAKEHLLLSPLTLSKRLNLLSPLILSKRLNLRKSLINTLINRVIKKALYNTTLCLVIFLFFILLMKYT